MPSKNQSETPGSSSFPSFANFTKWFKVRVEQLNSTKVSASSLSGSSSKKSPKRTKSFANPKLLVHNNTKSSNKKHRYSGSFLDEESWAEEIIEKDELILSDVPSTIFGKDEIYGLTITQTKTSNTPHPTPLIGSVEQTTGEKKNCLKNTYIVRGSVEHFFYVRTLRKVRSGREQRPLFQMVMLNGAITKLSRTHELPESQRAELRHYETRICEIGRRHHPSLRSSTSASASELSTPTINKKFPFVARYHAGSQVVVKYRPSYSSTKVLTVFDEDSKILVVKELPLARRKRRSNKSSISSSTSSTSTLVRSPSNSSKSSLSSLTTLADPNENDKFFGDPLKAMSSKLNKLKLSTMGMINTKNHKKSNTIYKTNYNDDDDDDDDDDVSLFVLKEQFKYSGRSCSNVFQGHSGMTVDVLSAEGNDSRLTLTV